MARIPLLLDVDTGIDDALALLLACGHPDAELVAVTAVAGNVALEQVVRNTRAVLELAGRATVEVATGAARPLARPPAPARGVHGPGGLGHATPPPPRRPVSSRPAAELIVDAARARPGTLALVACGPLTNVATALRIEPRLPRLLRRLALMGGGRHGRLDFNVAADPEAAAVVLERFGAGDGPAPLLVGLDVTRSVTLTPAHVRALARRVGDASPVVRLVADALAFAFDRNAREDGGRHAYAHDALAVAAELEPALLRTERRRVRVAITAPPASSRVVLACGAAPPTADVAVAADGDAIVALLLDAIANAAAGARA